MYIFAMSDRREYYKKNKAAFLKRAKEQYERMLAEESETGEVSERRRKMREDSRRYYTRSRKSKKPYNPHGTKNRRM